MGAEANNEISDQIRDTFSSKSLKFIVQLQERAGNDRQEAQAL